MRRWLRQLFCTHSSRSWATVPVDDSTTRTTGGCDRCGKWIPPGCKMCGR